MWSAKWTGTLTPAESGLYRFTLAESGIATLKIAGQTFGPAYREATQFVVGPHYVLQGTVRLTAGKPVPVEIDYSSSSALFSQEIHFGWQVPSTVGHPGRGAGRPRRGRRDRVRQRRAGRGHGPHVAVPAGRPGSADQRGRAGEPAHDRRAEHRRPGADAVAALRWTACSRPGIPARSSGPRSPPCCSATPIPAGRLPVTFPASDTQGPAPATKPRAIPASTAPRATTRASTSATAGTTRPGSGRCSRSATACPTRTSPSPACPRPTTGPAVPPPSSRGSRTPPPGRARPRSSSTSSRPGPRRSRPSSSRATPSVDLAPGQSRLVTFRLSASDLAYYDQARGRFTVAPGRYTVLVGTSSADLGHTATFRVG